MTQLSVGGKPTQVRIACALYPTSILLVKPRPGLFGNTKTLFSTLYFHVLRIKHIFSVNICQSDKNYRSLSEHGLAVLPVISVVTHGTPCRAGFHCSQLPREISGCTWHVDDTGVTAQKPVVVLMSVPTCAASEPARRRLPQPRPELWPWDQRLIWVIPQQQRLMERCWHSLWGPTAAASPADVPSPALSERLGMGSGIIDSDRSEIKI